jgi:hypothetical protein
MKGKKYAWNSHRDCHKAGAGAHTNSPKSHGLSNISSNGPSTGARLLRASPRTMRLSTVPRSSAHPYWRLIQQSVVDSGTMFTIFSNFDPLINLIIEIISQKLYFQFWLSCQTSWCGFELGHTKHPGATHGHVGIGYHINSDEWVTSTENKVFVG